MDQTAQVSTQKLQEVQGDRKLQSQNNLPRLGKPKEQSSTTLKSNVESQRNSKFSFNLWKVMQKLKEQFEKQEMPETVTSIDKILQNFTNVQTVLGDYDLQLNKVLQKHEDDFLAAYRTHMLKVEKELYFLKNKANEQESKLASDDRIVNLES